MKLLRLNSFSTALPPLAMSIGNFDGVHLGHQTLIQQLKQIAQQKQLKTAIMLFEPQPLEFFLGPDAPPRITSLREKLYHLQQLNIDYIILVKFNETFRTKTATQFAELLRYPLNVQHLVLGDDFHFGKNRQGNSVFLQQAGFAITNLDTIQKSNQRVSSTLIRHVLQQGDFATVAQLLGRPYSIIGRVVKGDQIGRTLNFPTANIHLKRLKPCLHGIYAVDAKLLDGNLAQTVYQKNPQQYGMTGYHEHSLFGAGHVGTRPAIAQKSLEWRLEVHFPQLSVDLYGMTMQITFVHYLHGEKNYSSLEALKQGIQQDVVELCEYRKNYQQIDFIEHS